MNRRTLPLRWLALVALFSVNCSPIRRPTRTLVEGDARLARAYDSSYGCEGEVDRWEHRHIGGSAAVRHEDESGLVVGGRVRSQAGEVVAASTPVIPSGRTYALHAAGAHVGYDTREVGFEAGVSAVYGDDLRLLPVPYARLGVGDLEHIWFDLVVGSDDPLHVARLATLGFGVRGGSFDARVGFGAYGHIVPIVDFDRERDLTLGSHDDGFDLGVLVDLRVDLTPRLGLVGGGVLGKAPAARLGLSWDFGGE